MFAAVVLAGGVWWAASDDDVTTVRSGGDVAALANGPSPNGAAQGSAADDHPEGPSSPEGTGPDRERNRPRPPEDNPSGYAGAVPAAGRRPPTPPTTGEPEGTPTTDPGSPSSSTVPPTAGGPGNQPTPPSAGHPGGGPPTTGTSRPDPNPGPSPGPGPNPGPGPDPSPGPGKGNERLVYTRDVSETDPADTDLFIGDLEGRHEKRLTSGPDRDQFPAWSPDGTTIAFNRATRSGSDELWSVRADGSGLRQLTFSGAGAKHEPAWSPDGRYLVFTAAYFNPTRVWLEVLDLATGGMKAITPGPMDGQPLWSPDGTTIIYTARAASGEDDDLFAVNPDGTGRRAITSAPFDHMYERYTIYGWSADGSRLLVYYKHPEEGHIIILRPDGTGRQDILSDRVSPPGPAQGLGTLGFLTWSPDERTIVFNGYNGLYVVNTDGSGHRRLDPAEGVRHMADWQPL